MSMPAQDPAATASKRPPKRPLTNGSHCAQMRRCLTVRNGCAVAHAQPRSSRGARSPSPQYCCLRSRQPQHAWPSALPSSNRGARASPQARRHPRSTAAHDQQARKTPHSCSWATNSYTRWAAPIACSSLTPVRTCVLCELCSPNKARRAQAVHFCLKMTAAAAWLVLVLFCLLCMGLERRCRATECRVLTTCGTLVPAANTIALVCRKPRATRSARSDPSEAHHRPCVVRQRRVPPSHLA